ncbi:uncharacterized protein THITE_121884 [Thermothielavioides terrestris NRRL 8126]|uniref:TEL2-interacting protein 1 n=1 Tax=Thermothielavioides terrestris (strain ATCC 38088 / NRRL 8126) TaxID=578455 RepID=G2RBN6_THETT|nr:uncharacterized protein THITE_121884 [Thermothielavioides terrestris NRRL 8126]AEO69207.1 hypothetical protein THITE_121884 [Thermothielavioides terrestris NRRL 8126]
MATVAPSEQRTEFFQQLKRVCVPLSQLALRPKDKAVDAKEALRLLEALIGLWTAQASKDAAILDDKLADYVFFPLSHLLRDRDRYPLRVIETVIRLLRELIQHGWKAKASPQLFQQLLVFLSFVIGGVSGQPRRDMPEETLIEGFRTLSALINVAEPSHLAGSADAVSEGKTIPALGHSVTVMLDGVTEGVAASIQLEAAKCLRSVFLTIKDRTVLAQFLPGTVSALTKTLSPPKAKQTQKKVLLSCLDVLKLVLVNLLGDIKVRPLLKKLDNSADGKEEAPTGQEDSGPPGELTPAWLKATAAQVKIALAAVLKLRAHESDEIQSALYRLCIGLLDECHASLAGCQSILVETAMMLEDESATMSRLETSLQDLAGIYPELGDNIKSVLYNWITSLPRVMQSSDERVKELAIRSILRGSKLAATMQMDSATLNDALGDSLRDSIVALVKGAKPPKIVDDAGADLTTSNELAKSGMELANYAPILLDSESQKTARRDIRALITSVGSAAQQVELATSMLSHIRDSEGVDQIASFWLAFELLKATYAQASELDDLLDLSSLGESTHQEEAFQELYDFSASVLSAHSDSAEADWRLEAIALEVTAFAASRLKTDFRPELIDVLYPVSTFLGSPVPQLRKHAITTLNILAASCGYESVSDLIVDNADYMVNSVSLRLNTFDISPASTKVLTMVIRLTGPRLVPFLDDVVAAIFAALDNYHGYPVFVESLFSVLSEVVSQGARSDMLLLEDSTSKTIDHRKKRPYSLGIPGILQTLDKRLERAARTREEAAMPPVAHPKQPWTDANIDSGSQPENQAASLLDKLTNPTAESNSDDAEEPNQPESQSQSQALERTDDPKQTPTYTLLARVLALTQHHLTSPSPSLRKSLLDLVATASPALAPDENAFLPLVHVVWPVVVARLRDPEPYVAVAACGALAALCRAAGDFLASRFRAEWWDGGGGGGGGLAGWVRRVKREAAEARGAGGGFGKRTGGARVGTGKGGEGQGILIPVKGALEGGLAEGKLVQSSSSGGGGGALGRFAQASLVWEAVVGLLTAVVSFVRLEDDMFDDILGIVVDVLPRHAELKEALDTVNADAVWLALFERGMVQGREAPVSPSLR